MYLHVCVVYLSEDCAEWAVLDAKNYKTVDCVIENIFTVAMFTFRCLCRNHANNYLFKSSKTYKI